MNKTLLIVSFIVLILALASIYFYKNRFTHNECARFADPNRTRSARVDWEKAAEESYYLCILKKGDDPYKYKWQGKYMRDSTMHLIEIRKGKIE